MPETPLLELAGVTKDYPGVRALDGVNLALHRGEIHALVGENGAGKSTLINVIMGAVQPSAGSYGFEGRSLIGFSPARIRALGISTVYQEFTLAPDLSVAENLFLGRELTRFGLLRRGAMRRRARAVIADIGFELPLAAQVVDLSRAQRQMVEIAKALLNDVKVLILDEPTASLTEKETERLFSVLERLRGQGVAILYVSHRMAELLRLADRITVLRDGALIDTIPAAGVDQQRLVEMMTGRTMDVQYPAIAHTPGAVALQVDGLRTEDGTVRAASFVLHGGEIVGIAGLVGCGKSEVARAVFGIAPVAEGTILLHGEPVLRQTPAAMLARGLIYFPADRGAEGLALNRPIFENMTMTALDQPAYARRGLLRKRAERRSAESIAGTLQLRPPDVTRAVANLSGGNRQKVMLARGLTRRTSVFLFDEPTVGIDVGAKREVYDFIAGLAAAGHAVLVVSSELPEILGLSHRAYVMSQGRIVAEHSGAELTEARLLDGFFHRHGDAVQGAAA